MFIMPRSAVAHGFIRNANRSPWISPCSLVRMLDQLCAGLIGRVLAFAGTDTLIAKSPSRALYYVSTIFNQYPHERLLAGCD